MAFLGRTLDAKDIAFHRLLTTSTRMRNYQVFVVGIELWCAGEYRVGLTPVGQDYRADIDQVTPVRSVPINRPSSSYTRPDYYGTIYNKGSLVIKTLTGLMGVENERKFWQEYAGRYSYTRVGPTDFYELADDYLPAMEGADARSIIGMTVPLDFEMMGFRFDRVTESDSAVADSSEVQETKYRNVITYAALHPIGTPVLLRLDFKDGTTMDTVVNPLAGQNELTIMHASSVSGAVIDPEYVYAVDVNWLNNSLKPGAGKAGSVRLFSGATFLVELLFGALWGW